ncbi:HAD family hydrolase [Vallitalea okinawensis]|uniref:HAD family hydrolase n=1 Tax=Vallitalea okinawensis TaxID=2078660 RepID=UPI000CFAA2C5|nr:HAD family hydrolase [Vallitalea okinawensis]
MNSKINTIIFDLDGTLLPMDAELFMSIYFDEMGKHFADLIDPRELINHVWSSTKAMITNLDHKTNEEVFMADFEKRINGDLNIYTQRFDKFYDTLFSKTRQAVSENDFIKKSIQLLTEKGYTLAIATNPLFPKKAILQRIEWAGLEASDFSYITHYENNHYCKPQIQFYEEVLQDTNKSADQCMMVGNDVREDLIAGNIGIKTFLIKDHMIHNGEDHIVSDYIGEYQDFYKFVINLPKLN